MELHQQRVVDEKNSLDEKAEKLTGFLGRADLLSVVDDEEANRLRYQLDLMKRYSSVLGDRIAKF